MPEEEQSPQMNPPKTGSSFASLMSKFSSGNDEEKAPSEKPQALDREGGRRMCLA